MSKDAALTKPIATLLLNRRFQVVLNSKKSHWHHQGMGIPSPGKCFSSIAVKYIHQWSANRPVHQTLHICWRFVHNITSKDLWSCWRKPHKVSLGIDTVLYKQPSESKCHKTQVYSLHRKNWKAAWSHKISWLGTELEHYLNPGVALNRTFSYRKHIENTKAKVNTRNNIMRKLTNSEWDTNPQTPWWLTSEEELSVIQKGWSKQSTKSTLTMAKQLHQPGWSLGKASWAMSTTQLKKKRRRHGWNYGTNNFWTIHPPTKWKSNPPSCFPQD